MSEADQDPNEYGGWGSGAGVHTNLGTGLFEVLHNDHQRSWSLVTKTRQDVREHMREHMREHIGERMREHMRQHIREHILEWALITKMRKECADVIFYAFFYVFSENENTFSLLCVLITKARQDDVLTCSL